MVYSRKSAIYLGLFLRFDMCYITCEDKPGRWGGPAGLPLCHCHLSPAPLPLGLASQRSARDLKVNGH